MPLYIVYTRLLIYPVYCYRYNGRLEMGNSDVQIYPLPHHHLHSSPWNCNNCHTNVIDINLQGNQLADLFRMA